MSIIADSYPFERYPHCWYFFAEVRSMRRGSCHKVRFCNETYDLDIDRNGNPTLRAELATVMVDGRMFAYWGDPKKAIAAPSTAVTFPQEGWSQTFHRGYNVKTHIQEIVENAADLAHFQCLHHYVDIPTVDAFTIDKTRFTVNMRAPRQMFGLTTHSVLDTTYDGLAVVETDIVARDLSVKIMLTGTPRYDDVLELNLWFSLKKCGPLRDLFYRAVVPRMMTREFTNDVPIWENKIYKSRAVLCESERNIALVRKWSRQFYEDPKRRSISSGVIS